MTLQFWIELILIIVFIFFFYHCCVKGARVRAGPTPPEGDGISDNQEDLRRFRERMSERGFDGAMMVGATGLDLRRGSAANSASAIASRKALVEKNLFSRKIKREESVRELQHLLAISRGNGDEVIDVELGECVVVSPTATTSSDDNDVAADANEVTSGRNTNNTDPPTIENVKTSSLPEPSAPPAGGVAQDPPGASENRDPPGTATDNIAIAINNSSSAQQQQSVERSTPNTQNNNNYLVPIRNLWTNLTHNLPLSERGEQGTAGTTSTTTTPANNINNTKATCITTSNRKLECSICLEEYKPNDTIAWAKDGGDPPNVFVSSAVINENDNHMGCDHIFHRGCITAWLEEHDECPLCRRKVVHADADVRFAGWEEMMR